MRLALLCLSLLPLTAAADWQGTAQQLLRQGEPAAALRLIDRQPADEASNALRLQALAALPERQLAAERPWLEAQAREPRQAALALDQLLREALAGNRPADIRTLAARRLATGVALTTENQRQWRERILKSYFDEERGREALIATRRLQQDGLLTPERLADLAAMLASLKLDASEFAPLLPENHAYQLWFARQLEVLSAEELRSLLAERIQQGTAQARDWQVYSSVLPTDSLEALAARERLLGDALPALPGTLANGSFDELLQHYRTSGEKVGRREQLIIGDDPQWLAVAERLAPHQPTDARALWVWLLQQSQQPAIREAAANGFIASCANAPLDPLTLAFAQRFESLLQPAARLLVGAAADRLQRPEEAVAFWKYRPLAEPLDQAWFVRLIHNIAATGDLPLLEEKLQAWPAQLSADDAQTLANELSGLSLDTENSWLALIDKAPAAQWPALFHQLAREQAKRGNWPAAADYWATAVALAPNQAGWSREARLARKLAGRPVKAEEPLPESPRKPARR